MSDCALFYWWKINNNKGDRPMTELDRFLADRTYSYPGAVVKLQTLVECFQATLCREPRYRWDRRAIVTELRKRYTVGTIGKVLHVGGISLSPPEHWATEAGKLVRRPAAVAG